MTITVNGDSSRIRYAVDLTLEVSVEGTDSVRVEVRTTGDSRLAVWLLAYGQTNIHIGYVDTILEAEALAREFATRWYNDDIAIRPRTRAHTPTLDKRPL